MAATPDYKLKWTKLKDWRCWAAEVPGGVLLHSEVSDENYGGRESMVFIPMGDKVVPEWIKQNKEAA